MKVMGRKEIKQEKVKRRTRTNQNNAIVIISLLIALIGVVGSTIVFLQNYKGSDIGSSYLNVEYSSNYQVNINFNDEVISDELKIKNNNDGKVMVRVKLSQEIKDKSGNSLDLMKGNNDIFKLDLNMDEFVFDNGYYYVKEGLEKGEEILFLNGISLNSSFINDEEMKNMYEGSKFLMNVTVEMIDAELMEVLWK